MNVQDKIIYEFGSFRLDPVQHILLRDGQIVPLTPKVFETLQILVENNGQVVDKDQMLQKIWSDTIVEETSLAKNISVLRKVLKENGSVNSCIETIPKRGYRFISPVKEVKLDLPEIIFPKKAISELTASTKKKIGLIGTLSVLVLLFILAGYWWAAVKTGEAKINSDIKAIAVLPFKPLTAHEEDQVLGLGMADALIIKLGQLDNVKVSPTSNIRRYLTEQQVDAVSVGQTLQVEAVLEGTIQRTNDRIRITAQLVNVADGRQIWSEKFDEKTTDFFVLQDAIAVRVANSLRPQLTESERQRLSHRETNNPEAMRFYVLGRIWSDKETTEGFNKSIQYLEKAIELDPDFIRAYSSLSYTYSEASESHLPPHEAMPKAKFYAERALQMDAALEWAHYQIARVKMFYDWDWTGAENSFKRALELYPDFSYARFGQATLFSFMGRRQDALANLEIAKNINPFSIHGSNVLYRTGEYDRAIIEAKKALEFNPNRISSLQWIAMSYEQKGMYNEALAAFESARQVEDTPELKAFEAHTLALMGKRDEALKVIAELKEISNERQRYVSPFYIAAIYAGLGEKDESFIWLEKAYQDRSFWIATLRVNPQFNNLRDDLRFQDLLKRAGL